MRVFRSHFPYPWLAQAGLAAAPARAISAVKAANIGQQLKEKKATEIPELSSQSLESLRTPARQLKEVKNRLSETEREYEESKAELSEAESELEAELERRGCQNLDDSLDVSGRMVNRLRKRVQLEEKLEKLQKDRKRAERDLDAGGDVGEAPATRTVGRCGT